MGKIYTFEFHFINPDTNKNDQTQFCAATQLEAITLYQTWCQCDAKFKFIPEPTSIDIVFNQDDADEYGDDYGKPEDYIN